MTTATKSLFLIISLLVSAINAFSVLQPRWTAPVISLASPTVLRSANDGGGSGDASSLTLYGHPGTRSPLVNWACYELNLDVASGDLRENPHPFGQIPCLTDQDGQVLVFESGAILSYLIQAYAPKDWTAAQKASMLSWITWANASLDPICFLETPDGKVYDTGLKQPNKRIDQLEAMLKQQKGSDELCLIPSLGFSVADVAVVSYLLYVVQFFPNVELSSKWPSMVQYMKQAASRPTYGQAFGQDLQAYLVEKLDTPPKTKVFGMF